MEKRELSYTVGGNENMENSMAFLKKLKTELPYDPAIPLLGIYQRKLYFEMIHSPQCSE